MIRSLRKYIACRRLARMVESNRKSPATLDFIRHREAMLRHTRET